MLYVQPNYLALWKAKETKSSITRNMASNTSSENSCVIMIKLIFLVSSFIITKILELIP